MGGTPVDLPPTTSAKKPKATPDMSSSSSPPSELQIEVINLPSNAASLTPAKKGDKISVHYVSHILQPGTLTDLSSLLSNLLVRRTSLAIVTYTSTTPQSMTDPGHFSR